VTVILLVGAGPVNSQFFCGFNVSILVSGPIMSSRLAWCSRSPNRKTQWSDFYEQSLEHIRTIPGVEAVGAIDNFFFASFSR